MPRPCLGTSTLPKLFTLNLCAHILRLHTIRLAADSCGGTHCGCLSLNLFAPLPLPLPLLCAGYWLQMLGTALPNASTYFLNYIIIHALCTNWFRFVW